MVMVYTISSAPFISRTDLVLFSLLLRLLHADYLAVLAGDGGGHLSAVRRGLVKLLPQLEFQFHSLECGGGLDGPDPAILGDLADRGGDGGRLPQEEVHVQLLEHLLVLVGGGPLVFPLEGLHGGGELCALTGRSADSH